MEKYTGSIDTDATSDTAKIPNNASKSDGSKVANRKYKISISDPIKLAIPKFTGRFTGISVFIYDLGPTQTDEHIKTTLEIEEYAGRTYRIEVRKSINELYIKVSVFIKPEDLTMDQQLSLMNIESYKLKIQQWFNRSETFKKSMRVMYIIVYWKCNDTMK